MDTRLVHPFISIVAGSTGCGKTTNVASLLRHSLTLVNLQTEKITWCYGEWQPLYSTLSTIHPNLECVEGLPDVSSFDSKNRNLVVIDDLTAQYMVLFKNPRDNTHVINLAKQMYPGRVKYMPEAFRDATFVPHGYLFVNLKQSTPEYLRLRSNILPDSGTYQYAYIPKI